MVNQKVVLMNEDILQKVKFVIKSIWIMAGRDNFNNPIYRQHAVIAIKNNLTSHSIIHPLTDFIFTHWKHRSYNTMKSHASNLCSFLNYLIRNKRKLGISNLADLDIEHATEFLNQQTFDKKSRETVLSYQRTLFQLFKYLLQKNAINNRPPFNNVILPSPRANNVEHNLPEVYILRFLELASIIVNPIALGIYLQIFGGLRVGEVVNIQKYDIKTIGPYGIDGLMLNIEKTQFRTDLKDTSGSNYVKKTRDQLVLGFRDWLKNLYKDHYENYAISNTSEALFLNKHGKPMSGSSYRYYFRILKKEFIKSLILSENPHDKIAAVALKNSDWSTHIGRGIFTNMIAEVAENPQEIALLRGDEDINSSLPYMANTKRMKRNLENYLELLYT
ncbi:MULTISPECIES: site-specific integrase [unclassified Bacillus (in: firmicutes)]|uniref:site-specific integrase n=1 Tax=unclassified Bacillus (in: firmicutes) TaxID=185979 RepID=UPI0008F3F66E|nr:MULTISPECIES: site-specific integrase [unclassified Bacillus (in: firmicutes)]SFB25654.1 Site-specific recombinase XerD [Bacillus sp. UNCCL13]SFQ91793.1 Site-specific recombinase XerD [Bacillus sp. cl95]